MRIDLDPESSLKRPEDSGLFFYKRERPLTLVPHADLPSRPSPANTASHLTLPSPLHQTRHRPHAAQHHWRWPGSTGSSASCPWSDHKHLCPFRRNHERLVLLWRLSAGISLAYAVLHPAAIMPITDSIYSIAEIVGLGDWAASLAKARVLVGKMTLEEKVRTNPGAHLVMLSTWIS